MLLKKSNPLNPPVKKSSEKMKLFYFTFILTDDCNFNCSYCWQKKEKKYMKRSTIEKTVMFFYPFLGEEVDIFFYGGEPLLAFDNLKYAVSLLQENDKKGEKKLTFSITTNGSLVTDEILHFFDVHRFSIMLSFDGTIQDITRKPGTLLLTRELIRRLQGGEYPGIDFIINSVFTPKTIKHLSESLRYIIELGGTDIQFRIAENQPWDEKAMVALEKELERLTDFLLFYYKEKGRIPVINFRVSTGSPKKKRNLFCGAGRGRMAVTPEENLWGCYQFHDYLKDKKETNDFRTYSFGNLDDFIKNHKTIYPRIFANYAFLRQDFFFTDKQVCFLCQDLEHCRFCPVYAAYLTSFIGKIPSWKCSLKRIQSKEKERFLKNIEGIEP
jgi:sulfatase maturation enzyme AslB (radical SAM superfamily)